MNIAFILKLLPRLNQSELSQLKARIDFLLQTTSSREVKSVSTIELLHKELLYKLKCPPLALILSTNMDKIGTNLKAAAQQIDHLAVEMALTPKQKAKLGRILVGAAEGYITERGIAISPRTLTLAMRDATSILYEAYPSYFGTEVFKTFVLTERLV